MTARNDRLYALDGLRLLCALAVAAYHLGLAWSLDGVRPAVHLLPHGSGPLLIYGFLGVEVFFMISGFVICMSGWGQNLRGFVASRAGRLYPAFWACVLITATVMVLFPVTTGVPLPHGLTGSDVAVNLTMLAGPLSVPYVDTVYWTLWNELRFYAIFAVLVLAGVTRGRVLTLCAVWLAASVVVPPGVPLAELVMPRFAPYFVAGMTLYLIRRSGPSLPVWLLLAATWLVSLVRVRERVLFANPGFPVPVWPGLLIITLAFGVLLAIALGATDRWSWRALAVAGAVSYPFYLLHPRVGFTMIRYAYERTGLPAPVLVVAAIVLLLAVAWLVHRLVERPATPALRRLIATGSLVPPPPGPWPRIDETGAARASRGV
ncbi:peptidoglycan/LPS O-acetylase OafA/YrhL [Catenuloplanes nepalensis]|uniref:Peptidoglycan/LPS O-acetylase OafA/YrhL n=1 Tax=Catenuloplanes nepalensis TaxID=587533 RepID=A0ABT9N7E4_9ACTN|nr:acyltransferase [Catenuloplanes nepalensis]MDP9799443.1 peptidoglycan/LPS O-acetylase OafA/YrhL [Catenuloplanes nepalensis]